MRIKMDTGASDGFEEPPEELNKEIWVTKLD